MTVRKTDKPVSTIEALELEYKPDPFIYQARKSTKKVVFKDPQGLSIDEGVEFANRLMEMRENQVSSGEDLWEMFSEMLENPEDVEIIKADKLNLGTFRRLTTAIWTHYSQYLPDEGE